jgi:hypothetical protein
VSANVRWATDRWAVAFSASEARRKQWGGKRVDIPNCPNVWRVGEPMRVTAPAVGEYADATAWQSVAYLTIINAKKLVWYSEASRLAIPHIFRYLIFLENTE